jgi:NhaP-type Na+/H+ or K+/H+ antiporter
VTSIDANSKIVLAVTATVLLSVLAQGLSAKPAIKLYGRQVAVPQPDAPEYA